MKWIFKFTLIFLFVNFASLLFGQNEFKVKQFKFCAGVNVFQGLVLNNYVPTEVIVSRPNDAVFLGVKYYESLKNKDYGFETGFYVSQYPFNYKFNINLNNGEQANGRDGYGYVNYTPMLNLFVDWSKKLSFKNHFLITAAIGFDIHKMTFLMSDANSFYFSDINQRKQIFLLTSGKNDQRYFVGFHTKIDFKNLHPTKFNNLGYCFHVHYSPQNISKGNYFFFNSEKNGYGDVKAKNNYMSIEFYYYITRKKNRSEITEFKMFKE